MDGLREKVADEIADIHDIRARDEQLEAADRILQIPEIAEALSRHATTTMVPHMGPKGFEADA